jgi:cyclopropane fatty-acyl-phospholipid synthase-like methyltransferase
MEAGNINDSFFSGMYKDVWKHLVPPGLTEVEVDFIQEEGRLESGGRVLDFMCGYGRHALALGRRGIAVTAVDNLPTYTNEISETARAEGLPVEAIEASALEMELEGQYDAAICMGNSFAFFNREEALRLLKRISAHLPTGGILLINSWMIAEVAIRHFKDKDWFFAGPFKYLLDYQFRFHPNRIESIQTIISPEGTIEERTGVDYIFTLDEMEELFQEAGLATRACYGTPRKRPFQMGDGRAYLVAEKLA